MTLTTSELVKIVSQKSVDSGIKAWSCHKNGYYYNKKRIIINLYDTNFMEIIMAVNKNKVLIRTVRL